MEMNHSFPYLQDIIINETITLHALPVQKSFTQISSKYFDNYEPQLIQWSNGHLWRTVEQLRWRCRGSNVLSFPEVHWQILNSRLRFEESAHTMCKNRRSSQFGKVHKNAIRCCIVGSSIIDRKARKCWLIREYAPDTRHKTHKGRPISEWSRGRGYFAPGVSGPW